VDAALLVIGPDRRVEATNAAALALLAGPTGSDWRSRIEGWMTGAIEQQRSPEPGVSMVHLEQGAYLVRVEPADAGT
jgi:hypothetical protein